MNFQILNGLLILKDFLQHINDENIFELLSGTINLRETRDARLAFECIRFLCGLFCHKKICLEWVTNGGVQLLIDVPQPSIGKFFLTARSINSMTQLLSHTVAHFTGPSFML